MEVAKMILVGGAEARLTTFQTHLSRGPRWPPAVRDASTIMSSVGILGKPKSH